LDLNLDLNLNLDLDLDLDEKWMKNEKNDFNYNLSNKKKMK